MDTETTKDRIIRKGSELVYRNGYNNTGIQDVLNAAGVPKGSFYFYFKNKEEFGTCLIDYYASVIKKIAEKHLRADAGDPVDALRDFFIAYIGLMKRQNFTCGCPIGNMAQEMSDLSEPFRIRIEGFFNEARRMIRECLEGAQEKGRLGPGINPDELAGFIFNSWEGSLIDMKVSKSSRPLDSFISMVFGVLLK